MKVGTTFSHRHAVAIGIDPKQSFADLLDFRFDVIRLCGYWDELQPDPDRYQWKTIEWYIRQCEKKNQEVVLTIGMKAPRWPEYFIPSWLSQNPADVPETALFHFLEKTIQQFKKYSCICTWQIENEAPDPSGPHNHAISFDMLQKEVDLARSLDTKPILLTLWGNELTKRKFLETTAALADIIGLDMYFRVPTKNPLRPFSGPHDALDRIKNEIGITQKPWWITELQAEPWEPSGHTFAKTPTSMNPLVLIDNYQKARSLDPDAVLLWGYEYWYWQRAQGDDAWWQAAHDIVY